MVRGGGQIASVVVIKPKKDTSYIPLSLICIEISLGAMSFMKFKIVMALNTYNELFSMISKTYLTTPWWPRKLWVQYWRMTSQTLIVESALPDASRVELLSKDIHDTGAVWIAYNHIMNKYMSYVHQAFNSSCCPGQVEFISR